MRRAKVFVNGIEAGILSELQKGREYEFEYFQDYHGLEVSRTMLPDNKKYIFHEFPPFFEGLLPEGVQLEGLLKIKKIDRNDLFSQLIAVGKDMVGAVTVKEMKE
ncbi:MAG: HipA N-terminal domain-containing protein [Bacteroidota bacterium]